MNYKLFSLLDDKTAVYFISSQTLSHPTRSGNQLFPPLAIVLLQGVYDNPVEKSMLKGSSAVSEIRKKSQQQLFNSFISGYFF